MALLNKISGKRPVARIFTYAVQLHFELFVVKTSGLWFLRLLGQKHEQVLQSFGSVIQCFMKRVLRHSEVPLLTAESLGSRERMASISPKTFALVLKWTPSSMILFYNFMSKVTILVPMFLTSYWMLSVMVPLVSCRQIDIGSILSLSLSQCFRQILYFTW